jgi:aminoglycoside phosphotransferase (APT) family kinase protein
VRQSGIVSYPTVARLDIDSLVRRIASVGGPTLVPIRALSGGAVGAWEVGNERGTSSVLTWAPPRGDDPASGSLNRAMEMIDIARGHGIPVPAYEAVIPLPEGDVAVLQEMVRGVLPPFATAGLVDSLVELADRRRDLLAATRFASETTSLCLVEDGPGFCLHGPLRDHDDRTRALLDRIEAIGTDVRASVMVGADLVHFDYHLGNVIVDPDDPTSVLAIVDWGGARAGSVALDLVVLLLDLVLRRSDSDVRDRVARHLRGAAEPEVLRGCLAHGILRLVDWRLRHSPEDRLDWLPEAESYLPS